MQGNCSCESKSTLPEYPRGRGVAPAECRVFLQASYEVTTHLFVVDAVMQLQSPSQLPTPGK